MECVLSGATYANITLAFAAANVDADCTAFGVTGNTNPVIGTLPIDTRAILYWTVDSNSNSIIDSGEHMVLAIGYNSGDRPAGLDKIRVEILLSVGSALTVERQIPNITNLVVDMG